MTVRIEAAEPHVMRARNIPLPLGPDAGVNAADQPAILCADQRLNSTGCGNLMPDAFDFAARQSGSKPTGPDTVISIRIFDDGGPVSRQISLAVSERPVPCGGGGPDPERWPAARNMRAWAGAFHSPKRCGTIWPQELRFAKCPETATRALETHCRGWWSK